MLSVVKEIERLKLSIVPGGGVWPNLKRTNLKRLGQGASEEKLIRLRSNGSSCWEREGVPRSGGGIPNLRKRDGMRRHYEETRMEQSSS